MLSMLNKVNPIKWSRRHGSRIEMNHAGGRGAREECSRISEIILAVWCEDVDNLAIFQHFKGMRRVAGNGI